MKKVPSGSTKTVTFFPAASHYHGTVPTGSLCLALLLSWSLVLLGQQFNAPAGSRTAHRHDQTSILPGGRIIFPIGEQHITGAGPFGLAVSVTGKTIVTANTGPGRNSLSILDRGRGGQWQVTHWAARTRETDQDD